MRRSILFKLAIAFWLVSVLGVVIMALLAGRVSTLEFNRFANEAQYQPLIDNLATYYNAHGSFSGAEPLLQSASQQDPSGRAREFLVVDEQGNILLSLVTRLPPGRPAPDLVNIGFPILVNQKIVARLIPWRPPRSPSEMVASNLQRINFTLGLGVVLVTLMTLVFGWIIARNIIQPLKKLDEATRSIAAGDLERTVNVSTRDEIGALAASFNQMTASLKRSRDVRRQMTADIAHELRNPLSIILGNAEALSEGVLPPTPQTLEIIYDEARHLSRLVDDLRTLSLSEGGDLQLQLSAIAPGELLEQVAAAYAVRASGKRISIQSEVDQATRDMMVDVERIRQVLGNLIDNSLKHTPEGGMITLGAQNAGEMVVLSVSDNGAGIPQAELPLVFDRFYRGKHAGSRLQEGSGLGLAISKSLVTLHGGEIWIESEQGKGTTICVRLPSS